MLCRYAVWLLIGSAAALALPAAAQRGNPNMEFGDRSIDGMVADFMAEHDVPGMALAIVQAPYITRATGFGVSDKQKKLLVGTNTLFDIGEMANAYTAVAVMQLVEMGKLNLDDPLGKHLPDLPDAWRSIPLRAVLTHASGIPDYRRAASYDPMRRYAPAALIALLGGRPLAFEPGHDVADSATDYLLLAGMVEAASGERYRDFVRRNQFERLGLRHTFFADEMGRVRSEPVERNDNRHKDFLSDPALINPIERATGYRADTAEPVAASAAGPAFEYAGAAILASAYDVSVWDIGLAGGILVKDPALRTILYNPAKLANGRTVPVMGAWRFPGRKGLMYVAGGARGQSAFLSRFTDPSELVCVTLLANKDRLDLTQLGRKIAGAYDKRLGPPPAADGMRVQQSPYIVDETLARFRAALRRESIGIRPGGGSAVGGGGPAPEAMIAVSSGRPVPLETNSAAAPALRATAWEEGGQVWVGYTDPGNGTRNGSALRARLDRALLGAVSPY
jgi:CubicO group peptidase (beta-lactamase class C family)